MDDPAVELGMMQLSDSFFPTGLFATSNGLESLFMDGRVTSAHELAEFSRVCLEQQVGPSDCIALSNAYGFAESSDRKGIRELDAICASMRAVKEARDASLRSGAQLARCVRGFQGGDGLLGWYYNEIKNGGVAGSYPVSFAVCCNALGIKREKALLMLLYGFVASNVGAALRLGMIQHLEGQRVIHELKPVMARVARMYSDRTVADMWQFAPQIEINQMSHEGMDSKMFIT